MAPPRRKRKADEEAGSVSKKQRPNFPKEVTDLIEQFYIPEDEMDPRGENYLKNLRRPSFKSAEKDKLLQKFRQEAAYDMTMHQLNGNFINYRRRFVMPILENIGMEFFGKAIEEIMKENKWTASPKSKKQPPNPRVQIWTAKLRQARQQAGYGGIVDNNNNNLPPAAAAGAPPAPPSPPAAGAARSPRSPRCPLTAAAARAWRSRRSPPAAAAAGAPPDSGAVFDIILRAAKYSEGINCDCEDWISRHLFAVKNECHLVFAGDS